MPSKAELIDRGRTDLARAIQKFGTYPEVASTLGYVHKPHARQTKWATVEALRPHLEPIVAELRRMPSQPELKARGREDLNGAIAKFGGFPKVAKLLGYPYQGPLSWGSAEDLRPHLEPLVAELGRMPTHPELGARGRYDLANAVTKFGGLREVAGELGYPYE